MKKILFYNWDKLDGNLGGGVSIYLQNLINHLMVGNDYKITYLNAGITYRSGCNTGIVETSNNFSEMIETYEIINSPVLAPVKQSICNLESYLRDKKLLEIINKFVMEKKFDIIHFNNLEGLSLSVLSLKKKHPNIKIIYSVHNYFPICSRTNLWKDEKINRGHNCDKVSYEECNNCYIQKKYTSVIFGRKHPQFPYVGKLINVLSRLFPDKGDIAIYKQFEEKNVKAINENVDVVLTVSNRVRDIMIKHGLKTEKVFTSYIGSTVANNQMRSCQYNPKRSDSYTVVYMGYMRQEKGFYFFIEAMEKMDRKLAKMINLKLVAKYSNNNKDEVARINNLKSKFCSVELLNGYKKETQKDILEGCDLGIVPVLWEDNLPQVAIEQIAYGVPILVSDLGGAQELCNNPDFVFKANDYEDFLEKISNIIYKKTLLNEFWNKSMVLVSMHDHVKELQLFYT